jgi:hypothetical protein
MSTAVPEDVAKLIRQAMRDAIDAVPDLDTLPRRVDRRAGASLVTRFFFPVSPRTIEAWPLATRLVNGKALIETSELLRFAMGKLEAAPAVRGGRRTRSKET